MNPERKDALLRVALIGMSDRMQSALRLFFKMHCEDICVQSDDESAEVSILDLDDNMDDDQLMSYRRSQPDRLLVVMSLKAVAIEGAFVLQKPLTPKKLRSVLARLHANLRSGGPSLTIQPSTKPARKSSGKSKASPIQKAIAGHADAQYSRPASRPAVSNTHNAAMALSNDADTQVGTMQDISPEDSAALARARYRPEEFFQNILRETLILAKQKNRYVKIATQVGDIIVYPDAQYVQTTFGSANACRALCSLPVGPEHAPITILPKDYHPAGSHDSQVTNADSVLWDTALFSARGRVPADTPLTAPIYLASWPNMTRLALFPYAMRIAALWAGHPYSLLETATVLEIPQRYVFAFYSAASALGHAGITRRSVDMLFKPPGIRKNDKRGLFGRILEKLGRNQPG